MKERLAAVRSGLPEVVSKAERLRRELDPKAAEAARIAAIGQRRYTAAEAAQRPGSGAAGGAGTP